MTEQDLIKAYKIKEEINKLDDFICVAEKVWTGKLIKERYIFQSSAYGLVSTNQYIMDTEMKNKVLDVLKEHLQDLKRQLEGI